MFALTLNRLNKALDLLISLLEEEFSALKQREVEKISALESSILMLLEQLQVEQRELRKEIETLEINRESFLKQEGDLNKVYRKILDKQKRVKVLSNRNKELAFALATQTASLLGFLQKKIKDSNRENPIYNAGGKVQGLEDVRKLRSKL